MWIIESFGSIRVSDRGGGVCHLPIHFSKNERGLGFSDTKGQRHECYVYKNRVIAGASERASERVSEFWPLAILVSLAFMSKNHD